jgi:hypothetical protein
MCGKTRDHGHEATSLVGCRSLGESLGVRQAWGRPQAQGSKPRGLRVAESLDVQPLWPSRGKEPYRNFAGWGAQRPVSDGLEAGHVN